MCFFSPPKIPKPDPIPPAPTRDNPDSLRQQEEQRKKLLLRGGQASTQLSGAMGDSGYGGSTRSVSLGSIA